jgi:hypothetical protein
MPDVVRCSRCILPETFPHITFNEKGVCNYCLNYKEIHSSGEEELKKILSRKGDEYDCIVPASGGKDSTYVLYYAKKILNLKVLAVHYDAGYQDNLALKNLERACKILDIPLIIVKVDFDLQKKLLVESLKMSENLGNFCKTCCNCGQNIVMAAWNTAKKYNVPYILYGDSKFEDGPVISDELNGYSFILKNIMKKDLLDICSFSFHFTKYYYYNVLQRSEVKLPIKHRFMPISGAVVPDDGVDLVHFYNYVEWDSLNKIEFLQNNLGWEYPVDNPHRFDCKLHCFSNFRSLKNTGISSDGINYCNMIRQNRVSREDALRMEMTVDESLIDENKKMLEELGLDRYRMPEL